MSVKSLNFMSLIELYLDQQRSIKESSEEVENSEAELERIIESLQVSELSLNSIDSYLQARASFENLKRIHEKYELEQERTKLDIMEILLNFPHLKKIKLNSSKRNAQFLLWNQEESTFTLVGFNATL